MDPSPLETAVRARLFAEMPATLDPESVARLVETKMQLVLPVLRESLGEDASPSIDLIRRAELEATRRAMKDMAAWMTNPAEQAAASLAKRELDATPPVAPPPDLLAEEIEARLAELEGRG